MNVGDVISLLCYFVGFGGLLFVGSLIIHEKFCKQCIVHWKNWEGIRNYTVVKACTESGASRIVRKNPMVKKVIKVVKCK